MCWTCLHPRRLTTCRRCLSLVLVIFRYMYWYIYIYIYTYIYISIYICVCVYIYMRLVLILPYMYWCTTIYVLIYIYIYIYACVCKYIHVCEGLAYRCGITPCANNAWVLYLVILSFVFGDIEFRIWWYWVSYLVIFRNLFWDFGCGEYASFCVWYSICCTSLDVTHFIYDTFDITLSSNNGCSSRRWIWDVRILIYWHITCYTFYISIYIYIVLYIYI